MQVTWPKEKRPIRSLPIDAHGSRGLVVHQITISALVLNKASNHDPTAAMLMRFIMHDDVDSFKRFIKIGRPQFN